MNFKLFFRVRNAVKNVINLTSKLSFNIKIFEKQLFMFSMYVEIFQFFVQVFVTRCSSHTIVCINNWLFSKNKINIMNLHSAHMNVEIWNIKNDVYFFDKFWIERFLIDLNNFWNDSIKMNAVDYANIDSKKSIYNMNEVRFSLEGLKSSWIFYENASSYYSFCVHDIRLTILQTSIRFAQKKILSSEKFFWHTRWWFLCSTLRF